VSFVCRKPVGISNFVEGVLKKEFPEKNEFKKLLETDSKYHGDILSHSYAKKFTSNTNGCMNR
jgi:hypothetical protein